MQTIDFDAGNMPKDFDKSALMQMLYSSLLALDKEGTFTNFRNLMHELRKTHKNKWYREFFKAIFENLNVFNDPDYWDSVKFPEDVNQFKGNHTFDAYRRAPWPLVTSEYDPISSYDVMKKLINEGWFPIRFYKDYTPSRTVLKHEYLSQSLRKRDFYNPEIISQQMKEEVSLEGFEDHWLVFCYFGVIDNQRDLSLWKSFERQGVIPLLLMKGSHLGNTTHRFRIFLKKKGKRNAMRNHWYTYRALQDMVVLPQNPFGFNITHRYLEDGVIRSKLESLLSQFDNLNYSLIHMSQKKLSRKELVSFYDQLNEYLCRNIKAEKLLYVGDVAKGGHDGFSFWERIWMVRNRVVYEGIPYTTPSGRFRVYQIGDEEKGMNFSRYVKFTEKLFEIALQFVEGSLKRL